MQCITDTTQIERWLEQGNIRSFFDTPELVFYVRRYEKGEVLTSPYKPVRELLFLTEGIVQIYGLQEDGRLQPISLTHSPALLGDVEFCNGGHSTFFAEARTDVVCITLSVEQYRAQLDCDITFLHTLLASYNRKLSMISALDMVPPTLEERVLFYVKNICSNHELKGVETAMFQLRCSRRQLQRVLKKLCDEGRLRKTGKGCYQLQLL